MATHRRYLLAIGELDQRVTLRAPAIGADALGQPATGWTDVATVWASVQPLRGREFEAGGAAQGQAAVRVRIRHRAGVTAAMQVVWQGLAHGIVGQPADVDGRGHTLELMCTAGAPV